jgi:phage gp36-like protein
MSYTTSQDFIDAFGLDEIVQLTNLYEPSATTINLQALEQNQIKARALIDGYISNCPGVASLMPFVAPFPQLLVGYELDIVRYFLDSLNGRTDVRLRYEDAIRDLRLIGRCELSLGLVGNPPEVITNSDAPIFSAPEPVFTRQNLRDFNDQGIGSRHYY